MTAGKGIQHSEMFPLLSQEHDNPLELFQLWLNLPKAGKFVEPYFKMFWHEQIPLVVMKDAQGKNTTVKIVAGNLDSQKSVSPPPDSWAANAEHDLAIWVITMEPDAAWTLPKAKEGTNRNLYFFEGNSITVGEQQVPSYKGMELDPALDVLLKNGSTQGRLLLLQGKPMNEPVVQHGPFVMNSEAEIHQTFLDYQKNQFGGWPWPSHEPVHPKDRGRFAKYTDGTEEIK
jgi:redox-sensitive bicupin YhaK (pirin superfamily)